MSLSDVEKETTRYLLERYKVGKRGIPNVNFVFKSNRIPLDYDNRVLGRVLKYNLCSKGLIELVSTERSNRTLVWRTCFNGGDMSV